MDRTDYPLLTIVALVALTAIIAMYAHARAIGAPAMTPTVQLVDGSGGASLAGNGLTGNVIAADRAARPAPSTTETRPGIDWSAYDYDNSGRLDTADSAILSQVISRQRFCPPNKICDVNDDGVVDIRDLGAFNAKLLQSASPVPAAVVTTPASQGDPILIAAAGAGQ